MAVIASCLGLNIIDIPGPSMGRARQTDAQVGTLCDLVPSSDTHLPRQLGTLAEMYRVGLNQSGYVVLPMGYQDCIVGNEHAENGYVRV